MLNHRVDRAFAVHSPGIDLFAGIMHARHQTPGRAGSLYTEMVCCREFRDVAVSQTHHIYRDDFRIDIILDKACYKDIVLTARETESQFLVDFSRLAIDILNLKAFIRLKVMKRPWTFFKKVFIEEGFIKEDVFVAGYDETLQQFAERLIHPGLANALKEGARALEETGHFLRIESLLDNVLMDENKKAKDYLIGIEPVAGYWYAKEQEIDNVRIILNGILIGEDPEYMEKFLGNTYFD